MHRKRLTAYVKLLAVTGLTLLLPGCQTVRRTEYKYIVPNLDFPSFPSAEGNVSYDDKTGNVVMSLDYYMRIYEFKVQVDAMKTIYTRLQSEVYESK